MKIFISYAREDRESATRLYRLLRKIDGVYPWLDFYDLLPGSEWEDEVMRALESSSLIVLLLSKHSVSKTGYVQRETREAIEKAKLYPPGKISLIPVRLDDSKPAHKELSKLHWVDLFPNWTAGTQKLLSTLQALLKEESAGLFAEILTKVSPRQSRKRFDSREDFLRAAGRSKDFSGYNLMRLDLSGIDLSGCSFRGANLLGVDLSRCILNDTDFEYANLERARFDKADLNRARLSKVNLWRASFNKARNIRFAIAEANNTFGVVGLGEKQLSQLKQANGFEANNYDLFFSSLIRAVNLTATDVAINCKWLGHRYFRLLFSRELRTILGQAPKLNELMREMDLRDPEEMPWPLAFWYSENALDSDLPLLDEPESSFAVSRFFVPSDPAVELFETKYKKPTKKRRPK